MVLVRLEILTVTGIMLMELTTFKDAIMTVITKKAALSLVLDLLGADLVDVVIILDQMLALVMINAH